MAVGLYFYSIVSLPLLDCNIIYDLSPIFTGILAWIFLHEDYGVAQFCLGLFGLCGSILVTQPDWLF